MSSPGKHGMYMEIEKEGLVTNLCKPVGNV
jgi:hypothetical protein